LAETAQPKSAKANTVEVTSASYMQVDLFGEDERMIEINSDKLKDQVYYLVAGHGGPDPGAQCTECSNTLCEDEYAYDITLRLARYLMKEGAIVHVVIQDENDGIRTERDLECDYDETCMGEKIPRNQKLRLRQRATAINKMYSEYKKKGVKDQVAIMIHVDSYENRARRQDAYFYHHKTSKSSKKLAISLQETFKEKYSHFQKNRGYEGFVRYRNLYMLNNTLPTSVYVELANIQNSQDRKRLVLKENREALAKWMYEGLTKA
jgi:N-acetylmuramoyl-L-alanine amidase